MKVLTVNDIGPSVNLMGYSSKEAAVMDWLENGIKDQPEGSKLPNKKEVALYLGVSAGCAQNAYRYLQDRGLIEAKQRIGTVIGKGHFKNPGIVKIRDCSIEAVKAYIVEQGYQVGEFIPSCRTIAEAISSSNYTVRAALQKLEIEGIIENLNFRGNRANWQLLAIPEVDDTLERPEYQPLTNYVFNQIKAMINGCYEPGDKLPNHKVLAEEFDTSVKTVHDASRILKELGIIDIKRGQYGSIVIRKPNAGDTIPEKPVLPDYKYESLRIRLRDYLATCDIGQKIPSFEQLAGRFNASPATIRKVIQELNKEGLLSSKRGRYGGTRRIA